MGRVSVFLEGYAPERRGELVARLARVARTDAAGIERMLAADGRVRLAAGVDEATALRFRDYLAPVGARLRFEADPSAAKPRPQPVPSRTPPSVKPPPEPEPAPAAPAAPHDGTPPAPRPLHFLGRLRWGGALFLRNLSTEALLLVVAFAGATAPLLLFGLGAALQGGAAALSGVPADPLALLLGAGLVPVLLLLFGTLVYFLVMAWVYSAQLQVVPLSLAGGDRAAAGASLGAGMVRLPALLTVLTVVPLATLPIQLLAGAAALLLGEQPLFNAALQVLALVLLLWLSLSLLLAAPVVALESIGPYHGIARAWRLARGLRLRMLGNFLLLLATVVLLQAPAVAAIWAGTSLVGGVAGTVAALLGAVLALLAGSAGLFLFVFFAQAFYFEARVLKEGWLPPWLETPDESWQLGEDEYRPAAGRGLRDWGEFALSALAAVALLALTAWLLPAPAPETMPTTGPTDSAPPAPPAADAPLPQGIALEVALGDFFPGEQPSLWLELNLEGVHLPVGADLGEVLRVEVRSVRATDGRELYDAASSLEQSMFHKVDLQRRDGAFSGIRRIHLRPGTERDDIATVHAGATLTLPLGIRELALTAADVDQPRRLGAFLVTLEQMSVREARLRLAGPAPRAHLAGVGGSADGRPITRQSSFSFSDGEVLRYTVGFDRPVSAIRVLLAQATGSASRDLRLAPEQTQRLAFGP